MMRKIITSVRNALVGIGAGAKVDYSIKLELTVGLIIFLAIGWYLWPLAGSEFLFLLFAYIFILVTEFINTAVETMLDRLHPVRNKIIGMSKDIAAAAVLFSFIFAGIVVLILLLVRWGFLVW